MGRQYSEQQKQGFKDQLKQNISTKIMTTGIFAIAELERQFGQLLALSIPYENLNDDEKFYRELWLKARDNILTNLNNQKKNAMAEIDVYDILYKGFTTNFVMRNSNRDVNGNLKENYNNQGVK